MRGFFLAVLIVCWPVRGDALIINVPGDFPAIQEGINAARNGDTVLVAPGIYLETITIENKNILLTSSQGPEATELKGFLLVGAGVDTSCVFRGFTVNADTDDPWYELRSLIHIDGGSPTIQANLIENGDARYASGGGISAIYSEAIIRDNIIKHNLAPLGGGIDAAGGRVLIEKNVIFNNTAFTASHGASGGGIAMSEGTIRFNLIVDNDVVSGYGSVIGGGIYIYTSDIPERMVYNNTIVGNSARSGEYDGHGGGILFAARSDRNEGVFFKNNIIAFNPFGGGVYAYLIDTVEVDWDYNLVFGNEGWDYLGIQPGPHDIQDNPQFVDRFTGNYHLLPDSPCIDTGDPDFPSDPDGSRADIGAYYFVHTVGIDDPGQPSGPYLFRLRQNYPNPFNALTTISYNLTQDADVSLQIYSITGNLVRVIVNNEKQGSGEHRYLWKGGDMNGRIVSSGIYFYELYVDDYCESKAMIMVK